jgi:SAM-dependent methyltransferase
MGARNRGALSGFQFTPARAGCEVHNVDPFLDYGTGDYESGPQRRLAQLNRAFKTDVRLHKASLPEADVDGLFDVVCSVSTLEHVPAEVLTETLHVARRLLKPDGRIVLTVDLFLNLQPFCSREGNQWGTNVSPKWIADTLEMGLVEGCPDEFFGFEEFSIDDILVRLEDFAVNTEYPQMAQLMVFGPLPIATCATAP